MPVTFYFVLTRPKPGQDAAFNEWYSKRHIYDLVAIPGIAAAQRYRLLDLASEAETPDYLAIYEFSDLDLALDGIAKRRGTDLMPSTDAIDRERSRGVVLKPTWDLDAGWRFGPGALDLAKLADPLGTSSLAPAEGLLVATAKQSRPGPVIFDIARFARAREFPAGGANAGAYADRLQALMSPITDRVAAESAR